MTSTHNANFVDIQGDDVEIDLQFQDFEEAHSPEENKNQTIYFNSFPDSAEDDQEKLLGDEGESTARLTHSFWSFGYYQQFFNVDSKQVGDRIIWSMIPKPGVNYLQSYIRPNPDLYGPFWICLTLVFTTAIAGNLSNYLQTPSTYKWKYDFHKVTLATSSIFAYAWLVPLLIWGVLLWRGSKANISLLEMICLYGYSLAIFVPVSLLWLIPLMWLQWCLAIVASVLSGGVLVRTIKPAISHEARKVALALAILILVLHAALALGFMLYFFYPPNATGSSLKQLAPSTTDKTSAVNQSSLKIPHKDTAIGGESVNAESMKAGGKGLEPSGANRATRAKVFEQESTIVKQENKQVSGALEDYGKNKSTLPPRPVVLKQTPKVTNESKINSSSFSVSAAK